VTALRFGRFEWLSASRELRLDGQPVSLGSRASDVLCVLIERRGQLVTKAELLETVWAGVVVEENNLQVQISTLRKLLGSQAIATIPGRGYRLSVEIAGAQPDNSRPALPVATASAADPSTNLLPEGSALLGRVDDLRAVRALISAHRLVTIVGSAGIGKTRLAQAAALEQPDGHEGGVWWIDLTDIDGASRLVAAIGARLRIALKLDGDARAQFIRSLRTRQLLLVLDNCESLLNVVSDFVGEAMEVASHVRWLCSTRVPSRSSLARLRRPTDASQSPIRTSMPRSTCAPS